MAEKTFRAVVADEQGEVFEHPFLEMVGMNGIRITSYNVCYTKLLRSTLNTRKTFDNI